MKSMFVKGGIALALAAAFGVNAPVVDAASIIPVQPTVAVVDANHAAIVGANTLLNAFIQQHPKAAITEIAFDGEDGQIKYEVEGFDSTGKYELKYNYNTNQIGETKEGAYKVSLEKKAFDPTSRQTSANRFVLPLFLPPITIIRSTLRANSTAEF